MTWVVRCDCGTDTTGETEDEIIVKTQEHARIKHSLTITREQAWALTEEI